MSSFTGACPCRSFLLPSYANINLRAAQSTIRLTTRSGTPTRDGCASSWCSSNRAVSNFSFCMDGQQELHMSGLTMHTSIESTTNLTGGILFEKYIKKRCISLLTRLRPYHCNSAPISTYTSAGLEATGFSVLWAASEERADTYLRRPIL